MTPSEPNVGDTIDGRYLLRREIARGGVGVVFEAVHRLTGSVVAVKLLHGEGRWHAETQSRLLREGRALATVRHPNIVEVLDAGMDRDGAPYLVLEMLEGRPLDGILASRRRLDLADVVSIGRQVCDALAWMHARGVIHRDLKPGNIFVARDALGHETVKLIDLGIASIDPTVLGDTKRWTAQGRLYGTAEYMAPEQFLAKPFDGRVDLYALGATLFECLTGDPPYPGSFPEVIANALSDARVPSVRDFCPEVPPAFDAVLQQALAKSIVARHTDAMTFGRALVQATPGSRLRTRLLGAVPLRPGARPDEQNDAPSPSALEPLSASAQRRRYARAPYLTPLRIVLGDGSHVDARSEDVSEGGLLAISTFACEADQTVNVRFALPTSGEIISMPAIVRWVKPARGRHAIGLEFHEAPPHARAAIATYVEWICGESDRATTQGVPCASPRVLAIVE